MSVEKRWVIPEEPDIPKEFLSAIGGDPLVARTLYLRGYKDIDSALAFLCPENYIPTPAEQLPDIDTAITLLTDAIEKQKHILVWGDFDVDGQTSTTTLVEGLRELGGFVSYHIPVRGEESHGITRQVLEKHLAQGFDLLMTCDTGISEHKNIQFIRNAGIPVIVTDHHSLGETLPPANAVINPQRLPKDHPLHTLPGVGVTYKLMEALFKALGHSFAEGHYQELAALGIVSDVAKLQGDARYLLRKGLESLRDTQRLGLQTLYKIADLNPQNLDETHIGFQIAPRLNAVGRLGDANLIVELLTTNDSGRARVLTLQIEAMNAKRRFTTRQVASAAETLLQMSPEDRHAPAIVLHHSDWPGGVVGIVASRLVEQYHKPVILLTGEDPIHGSARSVEGINITQAISSQSELLDTYGGHPMAAGMSMPAENFKAFKRGFLTTIEKLGEGIITIPEMVIDKVISPEDISLDMVEQINRLAPFGPDNPPLNFMIPKLTLVSTADVGVYGEHRQVIAEDQDHNQARFIWWNGGDYSPPDAEFDVVCQLSRSDYKGSPQVSAEWVDFRITEKGREEIQSRQFEIVDRRDSLDPHREAIHFLAEHPDSQVWGEGQTPEELSCKGRHQLTPTATLVIWTAPPSQSVLDEVMLRTKPKRVVVFGVLPAVTSLKTFLERLGGLAKFAVKHKDGITTLDHLASACAATKDSVRIGLLLWEAMGTLVIDIEGDHISISMGNNDPNPVIIDTYKSLLKKSLVETQTYRRYVLKGDLLNYLPSGKRN